MKRSHIIFFVTVFLTAVASAQGKTTIFLAGDSTMADKDYIDGRQERGWGMLFAGYFDNGVNVVNRARDGRSTKTFISEHRFDWILDNLSPGDYVFLQFGHNDSNLNADKGCPAQGAFKDNLRTMIDGVRARGGIPVLLTPICRRTFSQDGTFIESHFQGDTTSYQAATREVAEETGAVVLDAYARTSEWLVRLGEESSREKFMFGYNGKDNTHLSLSGAKDVCSMVCEEIAQKMPELARHLADYTFVVSKDGRGDFSDIQDAVDSVPDNSAGITTIRVLAGTYKESVIIPEGKNNIRIIGYGADSTTIEFDGADASRATVDIQADNVTVSGLCIIRKGTDPGSSSPLISSGKHTSLKNCLELAF